MKRIAECPRYSVTSDGRVYSHITDKFLKHSFDKNGYPQLPLREGGIYITRKIHRLVAEAFLANPECKITVNHIDGDKTNNDVSNLEWATHSENTVHAYRTGLLDNCKRAVRSTDKDGVETSYGSMKEACEAVGRDRTSLHNCLVGKTKTCAGRRWRFENER